jgi:hypothetical protein
LDAKVLQIWDLWFPEAAATGLPFARGRLDPTDVMWVHAAPETLSVVVREGDHIVARGDRLTRAGKRFPMTRLTREEAEIHREDRWPADADIGSLVILPGGEVGTLLKWWNADDESEWRWQVEFYNHQ